MSLAANRAGSGTILPTTRTGSITCVVSGGQAWSVGGCSQLQAGAKAIGSHTHESANIADLRRIDRCFQSLLHAGYRNVLVDDENVVALSCCFLSFPAPTSLDGGDNFASVQTQETPFGHLASSEQSKVFVRGELNLTLESNAFRYSVSTIAFASATRSTFVKWERRRDGFQVQASPVIIEEACV